MSPKRLVLFDIDGTILWGGALWKECFLGAFHHFYPGHEFPAVSFNGKTDVQICRELLNDDGLSEEKTDEVMEKIIAEYISRAEKAVETRAQEITVLPGVRELLKTLQDHDDILLGLLTGNVKKGAHTKLSCVDLHHHFEMGVFGDDHWDRYKLPQMALDLVKNKWGHHFTGKQIVIIGDTIHDVNCGKSLGVRTIAVGTGRNVDLQELLAQNPDYYFKDLSETYEVLQAIIEDLP